jgi:hypothetical protein
VVITGAIVDSERVVKALEIPGVMLVTKPLQVTALAPLLHSLLEHWTPQVSGGTLATVVESAADPAKLLPGEDPETGDPRDADRWLRTYQNLLSFKEFMLEQTHRTARQTDEGTAAELERTDIPFLEHEQRRLQARRDLWERRLAQLRGA